jgi:hypothetical protein
LIDRRKKSRIGLVLFWLARSCRSSPNGRGCFGKGLSSSRQAGCQALILFAGRALVVFLDLKDFKNFIKFSKYHLPVAGWALCPGIKRLSGTKWQPIQE